MPRPKIVVSHWVHPEVLEELSRECDVVANRSLESMPREALLERARDARAILAFMPDRIDAEFIRSCRNLGLVAGAFKGVDNVDVDACTARGIWVTVVPDLLTEPTAELAVALLLSIARRVREGDHLVRGGQFEGWRPILFGSGLYGRTVGIVGMGAVGRAVAARLAGFSCRLLYHDPDPVASGRPLDRKLERVSLPDLLAASDHVLLAVPLTSDSNRMIDAGALSSMKPGATLVNVGRGSVVDEREVAAVLRAGRLGGYATDVFAFEDLSCPDRPRTIPDELLAPDLRTVFTPHLGSAVEETRLSISRSAVRSILEFVRGEAPSDAINQPRLARAISER
jgi:phosphonate dehydrogenase